MFNLDMFKRRKAAEATRVEPAVSASTEQGASPIYNLQSGASYEQWREEMGLVGTGSVTRDAAMKLTSVFGCVSLLAGTTGTMPCRVVKKDSSRGTTIEQGHPAHFLVNQEPHDLFSAEVFFEGLFALAFLDGNAYAEIMRNRRGVVIALRPLLDAVVRPFLRDGRAAYSITENGNVFGRDQDDILHFRASATMKGLEALSPLKCFGRSIGIGLDADEYASEYFKQGTNPRGFISYEAGAGTDFNPDEVRQYWAGKWNGVTKSNLPAVLTNGAKFTSLLTDPETAQLFQSRSFQVLDVARAYGVPPHLIGETEKSTSWGTGINAQTTQFYILGLRKHIKRFESELTRKLLSREQRLSGISIKFNLDTLLRADLAARYDAHKISLGGTQSPGWATQNEIREMEGLTKSDDPIADLLFRPTPKASKEKKPEPGDDKSAAA